MNERIKLPAQEWLGYDPERGDLHGYTFEQMREFAQLIVKECIQVADHSNVNGKSIIGERIKEHFGVEE
jgi:hypothetical protein